ncbi:MAG: 2TM domain-containing protein [Aurantibacter sp.]
METKKLTTYQRAQKRVAKIMGFYNHLAVYLIVNIVLYLLRDKMTVIFLGERVFDSLEILKSIDWDIFGIPIIWGIFLIIHAVKVFGNFSLFGRNWEEKKIRQFMEENKD